ncbi:MAG: thioredoxin family protein [Planctomycetota bacterium]|nr:thioredoxin family protein [Planctomycetota bacterium]
MLFSHRSAAFLFLFVLSAWQGLCPTTAVAADTVHVLYDNDQAVALTKKTGKPLLAIGGTLNCPYCVKMAKQLETNEKLAPLASKFVILKIDTSTPLWKEWTGRYEVEGDGVPQVIILRGDGKQLYGKTGAPVELDQFLQRHLADAGKILSAQELTDLDKLLKEAQKFFKRKDYSKAIELGQECVHSDCYASTVNEARKLLSQIEDRSKLALKDAEKKLASKDKSLDGAIALLELAKTFEKHTSAYGPIAQALEGRQQDSELAPLFAQAALVTRAQQLESAKKKVEALAVWQSILEQHPDTPAATLAEKRIADIEKRSGVAQSAKPEVGANGDSKRAASFVRLGKQLLKSKPADARDYFERAIATDPDSAAAEEARELLEKLD